MLKGGSVSCSYSLPPGFLLSPNSSVSPRASLPHPPILSATLFPPTTPAFAPTYVGETAAHSLLIPWWAVMLSSSTYVQGGESRHSGTLLLAALVLPALCLNHCYQQEDQTPL